MSSKSNREVLIKKLRELLTEVRDGAGASFSGVGLIISHDPSALPIVPLRPIEKIIPTKPALDALLSISNADNEFHDGFHVLSPELELICVSQYFSPPIVQGLCSDPTRRLGGRYMAALFGSTLSGVLATGVASVTYGVAVFEQGNELGPVR